MKKQPNQAIRELRQLLGRTQGEFAAMIGASKDAVVSWELGRNPLSEALARRIGHATGVDPKSLTDQGPLRVHLSPTQEVYTVAAFERHRKKHWGSASGNGAERQVKICADALGILLRAAVKAGEGSATLVLPAVVDSFVQWCRQTEEAFQLIKPIDEELAQRQGRLELTKTYGQWREMARTDPTMARGFRFVDKPKKGDGEELTLGMPTIPVWAPGWDMRGDQKPETEITKAESGKRKVLADGHLGEKLKR